MAGMAGGYTVYRIGGFADKAGAKLMV